MPESILECVSLAVVAIHPRLEVTGEARRSCGATGQLGHLKEPRESLLRLGASDGSGPDKEPVLVRAV